MHISLFNGNRVHNNIESWNECVRERAKYNDGKHEQGGALKLKKVNTGNRVRNPFAVSERGERAFVFKDTHVCSAMCNYN